MTPVAGGSGVNTATHLASLARHYPFLKYDDDQDEKEEKKQDQNEEQQNDEEQMDVTLQTVVNEKDGYGTLLLNHAKLHNFEIINCRRDGIKTETKPANGSKNNKQEQEADKAVLPSTGHCIVLVTQNERSFITHLGVMEDFQPSHTILHELVQCRSADPSFTNHHHHIHIAGYYNSPKFHSKNALKKRIKLIREKRRTQSHGHHVYTTTISLTPQYDATEKWDTNELFNLLPLVDFLILNLLEACKICKLDVPDNQEEIESGTSTTNNDNQNNASSSQQQRRLLFLKIADYLDEQSPQTYVILTLGKGGAVLLYGGDIVHIHQAPIQYDTPIDTTGAGDAFVAGFLFGAMNWRRERQHNQVHEIGSVLEEAGGWTDAIEIGMEWGCVTGTACVMKAGASVPSSKKEIEDLLYYDGEDDDDEEEEEEEEEDGIDENDGKKVVIEVEDEYDSELDSDYDPDDDEEYEDDEDSDDETSDDDEDYDEEEEDNNAKKTT